MPNFDPRRTIFFDRHFKHLFLSFKGQYIDLESHLTQNMTLWGRFMNINERTLGELALALRAERKRQKLSRDGAAAVCGVSASFIRDAESSPENCTLAKLAKLVNGLGLSLEVAGLERTPATASAVRHGPADFGVSPAQLSAQDGLT